MVTIKKCIFCGREIEPGTGKMIVAVDGSVSFLCSSKCEKNVRLKRSSRKVKWTQAYRKEKVIRVQHLKESAAKAPQPPKEAEKPKAERPDAQSSSETNLRAKNAEAGEHKKKE